MRCIFCKQDSSSSRSVEHIIPESLGNEEHVLRPGIVCDRCNNYFAREVEKPFLEYAGLKIMRFYQGLESKRGRVPPLKGMIFPDIQVDVEMHVDPKSMSVCIPEDAVQRVMSRKSGSLFLPREGPLPEGVTVSRFLAKIAVEAFVKNFGNTPDQLDQLCDEAAFDAIRDHARLGKTIIWPTHARRLYGEDAMAVDDDGTPYQVVHEFDFLQTNSGEWYFVLAIFGYEMAINLAGPSVDGYKQWLVDNSDASPLYTGRNAFSRMPRV